MAGSWSLVAPSGFLAAISQQSVSSQEGPSIWSIGTLNASLRTALSGRPFNVTDPGSMELAAVKQADRSTDALSYFGLFVAFCAGRAPKPRSDAKRIFIA